MGVRRILQVINPLESNFFHLNGCASQMSTLFFLFFFFFGYNSLSCLSMNKPTFGGSPGTAEETNFRHEQDHCEI